MHIFVTGGDGLLGANLVRLLLARGDRVRVLVYPGSNATSLNGLDIERAPGDLCDEQFDLAGAMSGCDAVFHCAAVTDWWATPELTWRVNLDGTRNLCEACVNAGVLRLVNVGSASSYTPGPIDAPGDETTGFPDFYRDIPYMASKHAASDLVRGYVREGRLDAVITAPTFMLGPHDARPSGGEAIRRFLTKGMKYVPKGGRNIAYAPDVAAGCIAALEKGRTGESYILGGRNMNYFDFFALAARVTKREPPKKVLRDRTVLTFGWLSEMSGRLSGKQPKFNRMIAQFGILDLYYSHQKAIDELGMPQTPTEKAVADSVQALIDYGHIVMDEAGNATATS
jgi:dihydroflavonol-4-reductase